MRSVFLKGLFSIRLEDHRRVFLKTSPNRIRTQQSNRLETFLVAGKKRAESAGRFSDLRLLRFRVDYVFIVKIG